MDNLKCYGDRRNKGFCVHCGRPDETDDHVPSKVLLDEPYPENLMVCRSCFRCNNDLSSDETYLACLLECVLAGEVEPAKFRRSKIATVLSRDQRLLRSLQEARSEKDGSVVWNVDNVRVRAVILKLARCHAAYEYNEPQLEDPRHIGFKPLLAMTWAEEREFERSDERVLAAWPEVGSRAMQRLLVVDRDVFREGWLVVQDGNYRYCVTQEGRLKVKIILREYLACEVIWN